VLAIEARQELRRALESDSSADRLSDAATIQNLIAMVVSRRERRKMRRIGGWGGKRRRKRRRRRGGVVVNAAGKKKTFEVAGEGEGHEGRRGRRGRGGGQQVQEESQESKRRTVPLENLAIVHLQPQQLNNIKEYTLLKKRRRNDFNQKGKGAHRRRAWSSS